MDEEEVKVVAEALFKVIRPPRSKKAKATWHDFVWVAIAVLEALEHYRAKAP